MLLDVERTGVEGEPPRPTPGKPELGGRQHRRHEVANGKGGNLDGDLGYDEGLRPVGEELVEKREEGAGQQPQRPHSEGPNGEGRVVGVGHG